MNELERMAGNVIVCGFAGLSAPAAVQRWLSERSVAGLILFTRNIDDLAQATELIATCSDGPILRSRFWCASIKKGDAWHAFASP